MKWLKKLVQGAVIILPPWFAFSDIGYTVRRVEGVSMKPTFNPEGTNMDYVLLNRWGASSLQFEKGEVVSLVSPKNPSQWLIKRVVALEGDEVVCHSCFGEKVSIPKGHCWVEGDNLEHSLDSNNFGPVSMGLITAKASRVVWPPERWGKLEKKELAKDRVVDSLDVDRGHHFFGWDVE